MENLFVIGDVHACYHTFKSVLNTVDFENTLLVQVGDLIDRGNVPIETLEESIRLEEEYGAVFLMGNHEAEFIKHIETGYNPNWLKQGGEETIRAMTASAKGINYYYNWILKRPRLFENEQVLITHAGVSGFDDAMNIASKNGILWYRGELKNIGKLQVHGHTPIRENGALYNDLSNSWNIDTASCYGNRLSGLKIELKNMNTSIIEVKTHKEDIIV